MSPSRRASYCHIMPSPSAPSSCSARLGVPPLPTLNNLRATLAESGWRVARCRSHQATMPGWDKWRDALRSTDVLYDMGTRILEVLISLRRCTPHSYLRPQIVAVLPTDSPEHVRTRGTRPWQPRASGALAPKPSSLPPVNKLKEDDRVVPLSRTEFQDGGRSAAATTFALAYG
jgi:hypothetical protein